MQSKMFVFVGLTDKPKSVDLTVLLDALNRLTIIPNNAFTLRQGSKLVTAVIGDVSYYVSYTSSKKDLKDWLQLKTDFELSGNMDGLDNESLSKRFMDLKKNRPGLYTDEEYVIAMKVFDTMSNMSTYPIIAFH